MSSVIASSFSPGLDPGVAISMKNDFLSDHFVLGENRDPHASAHAGLAQDDELVTELFYQTHF